jgi:hypothetical protein
MMVLPILVLPLTAASPDPVDERWRDPRMLLVPGERLEYVGDFGVFGKVGSGVLSVSDLQCIRDRPALQLSFNFRGRVMLMGIRDETSSWVDPQTMHALRYEKEERHPMGGHRERVDIFPENGTWRDEAGATHALPTTTPLDELSFLFLARAVRLPDGEMLEISRHFDPERNPVRIRDRGRERIEVPAGTFDVRVLEMEVRDTTRFGGTGRITLHVTDDQDRIPVRIATAMPVVGALVLVLDQRTVAPVGNPAGRRLTC